MEIKHTFAILSLICASACSFQYKAVAYKTGSPNKEGLMVGDIVHYMSGGGTVKMKEHGGDTICEGTATSVGVYDGTLDLKCTDGRTVTGTWEATTLKSGTGKAQDSEGTEYDLVFGLTDHEVQQFVDYQVDGDE